MRADDLVALIEQRSGRAGRRIGHNVRVLCPAHDDHHPSLDVAEGANGQAMTTCRSQGCTYEQILAALGIDESFGEENGTWTPFGPALAVYRYTDEGGTLLYEVCRTAAKQFPQRRPDPTSPSGWRWKLGDVRRVPYRLPEVVAAVEAGETIYLVEGEKDADRLYALGHVATTSPGGAGNWRDEYATPFLDANVIVIADRDEAGYAHARTVARSLERAGAHVRIRQPAVEFSGADVSDHLAAGLGLDALIELPPESEPLYRIVTAEAFAAVEEQGASPLLGTTDGPVIPEGGDVMLYGDGGVGKTTLSIDLAFHLAAGEEWLGIPVPRPLRILLIENEGPRPLFRKKLARKLAAWEGSPIEDRIRVVEHPWAAFSFADEDWRQRLASVVSEHDLDLVIAGPVVTSGMESAGTMQEVRAFVALIDDVRRQAARRFAALLVHHENKGGKVSGAWEGSGDTLLHAQQQGHGKLRLFFQKARWASDYHLTTLHLSWDEGASFSREDQAPRPERVRDEIQAAVLLKGGRSWNAVVKAEKLPEGVAGMKIGGEGSFLAKTRDSLLREGLLVNTGSENGFVLWHRDDPERPLSIDDEAGVSAPFRFSETPTVSDDRNDSQNTESPSGEADSRPTVSVLRPYKGEAPNRIGPEAPPDALDDDEENPFL